MKFKGKGIAMILVIALIMTLALSNLVMAQGKDKLKYGNDQITLGAYGNKYSTGLGFKDVGKHWARKNIEKLTLQGVMNGYPGRYFKPQAPVTRVEAVVMAVNLLGLGAEAKAKAGVQLPYTDNAAIPAWARGSVAVAIDKGLVPGTGQFQPMKKATRLYVTILLVKTLDLEVNLKTGTMATTFIDIADLDKEQKQYIALAVWNDLIKASPDKCFKPNKPVTRAEMAALLARLQEQTGSNLLVGRVVGRLIAVNPSAAKVSVATAVYIPNITSTVYAENNSLHVYELTVASNATIYRDNKPAALNDLKAGDKVTLLLNKDQVVIYIEAKAGTEPSTPPVAKAGEVKIRIEGEDFKIMMEKKSTGEASVIVIGEPTNEDENSPGDKKQKRNQNRFTVESRLRVQLTGAEAVAYIEKFITDAELGDTVKLDKVITAAEKILGITIDKDKVEIEIKIKDSNSEIEFKN